MAERKKMFKCPLCDRVYMSCKSLLRHVQDDHAGTPNHKEVVSSLPKDICQHCGEGFAKVARHEKT